MPNGGKCLSLDGVSRHFAGLKAVDDVSFSLEPGEILALVGPNGAGKSTIMQLISGIERPSAGSIVMNGVRLDNRSPAQIARLGIGRDRKSVV
jgi:branched-chain amino acid transport system ATP-binding protein